MTQTARGAFVPQGMISEERSDLRDWVRGFILKEIRGTTTPLRAQGLLNKLKRDARSLELQGYLNTQAPLLLLDDRMLEVLGSILESASLEPERWKGLRVRADPASSRFPRKPVVPPLPVMPAFVDSVSNEFGELLNQVRSLDTQGLPAHVKGRYRLLPSPLKGLAEVVSGSAASVEILSIPEVDRQNFDRSLLAFKKILDVPMSPETLYGIVSSSFALPCRLVAAVTTGRVLELLSGPDSGNAPRPDDPEAVSWKMKESLRKVAEEFMRIGLVSRYSLANSVSQAIAAAASECLKAELTNGRESELRNRVGAMSEAAQAVSPVPGSAMSEAAEAAGPGVISETDPETEPATEPAVMPRRRGGLVL